MKKKLILCFGLCLLQACPKPDPPAKPAPQRLSVTQIAPQEQAWKLPAAPPTGAQAAQIRYGQELIRHTPVYLGPEAPRAMRFAGNHLNCANCHLQAGQQANALGFVGIAARFPQYRPRENQVQTLANRVNGCMERSLNGKALPLAGKEMQAILAYMAWLSQGYTQAKVKGQGLPDITLLSRAADPVAGKKLFAAKCAACHQSDGQGLRLNPEKIQSGYLYPPLWGPDSFNEGAGMHRLITAARFIKANMPLGTANLTHAEAFDVAAYINSQPRPLKAGLDQDYPDRSKKPVDAPFGPWNDHFSPRQHQFGPFGPMLKGKLPSGG